MYHVSNVSAASILNFIHEERTRHEEKGPAHVAHCGNMAVIKFLLPNPTFPYSFGWKGKHIKEQLSATICTLQEMGTETMTLFCSLLIGPCGTAEETGHKSSQADAFSELEADRESNVITLSR